VTESILDLRVTAHVAARMALPGLSAGVDGGWRLHEGFVFTAVYYASGSGGISSRSSSVGRRSPKAGVPCVWR